MSGSEIWNWQFGIFWHFLLSLKSCDYLQSENRLSVWYFLNTVRPWIRAVYLPWISWFLSLQWFLNFLTVQWVLCSPMHAAWCAYDDCFDMLDEFWTCLFKHYAERCYMCILWTCLNVFGVCNSIMVVFPLKIDMKVVPKFSDNVKDENCVF